MSARTDARLAAEALTRDGQSLFSPIELIARARQMGSAYPESTLRTHIVSFMCGNATSRFAGIYPDLVRVGRGLYKLAAPPAAESAETPAEFVVPRRLPVRLERAEANVAALTENFQASLEALRLAMCSLVRVSTFISERSKPEMMRARRYTRSRMTTSSSTSTRCSRHRECIEQVTIQPRYRTLIASATHYALKRKQSSHCGTSTSRT
jgi:hypothetical protein